MNAHSDFWSKFVRTDSGCLIYTGKPDTDGYGHIRYKGRRQMLAHRARRSSKKQCESISVPTVIHDADGYAKGLPPVVGEGE